MKKGHFDTQRYRSWFEGRLRNADLLGRAQTSSIFDMYDAEALICCAVSAVAADTWPGEERDKRRFVEFLVKYGSCIVPPVAQVSVPLLYARLGKPDKDSKPDDKSTKEWKRSARYILNEKLSHASGGEDSRVLNWNEIDAADSAVSDWLVDANPAFENVQKVRCRVRQASYAAVIYRGVRNGLIHEHNLGAELSPQSMAPNMGPRYVNYNDGYGNHSRRLYLPYDYIREVARSTVEGACKWLDSATEFDEQNPFRRPDPEDDHWWLLGW